MRALAELGHRAVGTLERQDWLQPIEEKLRRIVAGAPAAAGRRVRMLHGTWLDHARHPVLTDVPIGAWTMAVVFDVLDASGRGWWRRYRRAAERAVAAGTVGAAAAAVTGMADWTYTSGRSRRVVVRRAA